MSRPWPEPELSPSALIERLGRLVQAQSSLLSYIDVFWGLTIAAALLIPIALFLPRPVEVYALSRSAAPHA